MKRKTLTLAALAALPFMLVSGTAQAGHCKQYSKTIRIGGNLEVGIGKACEQPDGAWKIVSLNGPREIQTRLSSHIHDHLHDDGYYVVRSYERQ